MKKEGDNVEEDLGKAINKSLSNLAMKMGYEIKE